MEMERSDPFVRPSIVSLNPRTFGDSKDALQSRHLEAIHQHMLSMAFQSPEKHFEKAKSIIGDGGSEFINTKESEESSENARKDKRKAATSDVQKAYLEYKQKHDCFWSEYKKRGALDFPLVEAMEILPVSKRRSIEKAWHDQNKKLMDILNRRTTLAHEIVQDIESSPSPSED